MKKVTLILFLLVSLMVITNARAQTNDDLLNLLISKNLISQIDADSIRADAAIKAQDQKEKQKSIPVNAHILIQICGYTQVRFQSLQEAGKADAGDIRRARLDFRGNVTPNWEYRLQTEMAVSPKLIDAYTVFKPSDYVKLEVGQFKLPLSLENLTPSNNMETIERAQVVEALVNRSRDVLGNNNGRDVGVQLFGSLWKKKDRYIIDYFGGVFDGAGINVLETNEAKDFAGRLVIHPIKGLDVGGAIYRGSYQLANKENKRRNRIAAELSYTYKIITVKGEYIEGEDGDVKRSGYYAQASGYILHKKLQLVARYDVFDTNLDVERNVGSNVLGGVNYFINDWVKLQVNYTSRNEEGTTINNDIIGAQLQISF